MPYPPLRASAGKVGEAVEYSIVRSSRRTLALEVTKDGEVIVRAPRRCPKSAIDDMLKSRADWIDEKVALQKARRAAHPEPTEAEAAAYLARAKAEIPPKVLRYGALMSLTPAAVSFGGAKTRFGSCSYDDRLRFSWRLMQYPDEAVDYVVVHELAHIVHKNHGKDFYALIGSVLPDYKARQALLRK